MISSGRDNPDFDSVLWIPVQELIIHKNLKIQLYSLRILSISNSVSITFLVYYVYDCAMLAYMAP